MDPFSWGGRQRAFASVLDIQRLVDEHPLLIELEISGLKFALNTVNLLIFQLNSLKQLRFPIEDRLEYDRLVSQLDVQWRPSFIDEEHQDDWQCAIQLER